MTNHLTSVPDFISHVNIHLLILIAPGETPVVKAYDDYVKSAIVPLARSCDDLGGGLQTMGSSLTDAWEGIRTIMILSSRSKTPSEEIGVALAPHLAQTQAAAALLQCIVRCC
jgi:hypothetical protein